MAVIPNDPTYSCMYFVGGDDYKANSPQGISVAGGCTKDWWDSQANIDTVAGKQTAMGKLMGSDGEPLCDCSTTESRVLVLDGKSRVMVTDVVGTAFANAEVGMLAYHEDIVAMLDGGPGVFRIMQVSGPAPAGYTYIVLETVWLFEGWQSGLDGSNIVVGGAWSDIKTLAENFVDASVDSQEIWVNKDLAPTVFWDLSSWSGETLNNTWMYVRAFNRVPYDLTDPDSQYFQSSADAYKNGPNAESYVDVDVSGLGSVGLFDENYLENILFSGFYFNNAGAGVGLHYSTPTGAFSGFTFIHNYFDIAGYWHCNYSEGIFFFDNVLINAARNTSEYIMNAAGLNLWLNNFFGNIDRICSPLTGVQLLLIGNVIGSITAEKVLTVFASDEIFSVGNTYLEDSSYLGTIRENNGGRAISVNDIMTKKSKTYPAFSIGSNGGSILAINPCAFADDGNPLDNVMYIEGDVNANEKVSEIFNLLEADPLFDANLEPLEELVRIGGSLDMQGDPQSMGAIKTMNITIINTAVQDGLIALGYTAARSPKIDNLDALANGVKLTSDGLDNVVIAEPSGDSSGWTFAQGLKWLIMRFKNKHTSDNFSGISVHKEDETVSTTQPVTEVNGVRAVSKAQ